MPYFSELQQKITHFYIFATKMLKFVIKLGVFCTVHTKVEPRQAPLEPGVAPAVDDNDDDDDDDEDEEEKPDVEGCG